MAALTTKKTYYFNQTGFVINASDHTGPD